MSMDTTAIWLCESFCVFFHLAWFSQRSHNDTCGFDSFALTSVCYFGMGISRNLFISSSREGHLRCLCFTGINRASVNTRILVWTLLESIYLGAESQSWRKAPLLQVGYRPTALSSDGSTSCPRRQHLDKMSCLTTSLPTSALVRLFIFVGLMGVKWYLS